MLTLSEFLDGIEFSYKINNDNTISLIDLQGANLGNIESEKFKINDDLPLKLVNRLDTYLKDYHFKGIIDTLDCECQCKDDVYSYNTNLIPVMKKYLDKPFSKNLIEFIENIVYAKIDISELIKKKNKNERN